MEANTWILYVCEPCHYMGAITVCKKCGGPMKECGKATLRPNPNEEIASLRKEVEDLKEQLKK